MKQEILKIERDNFAQFNIKLMENLAELGYFLEKCNLPKVTSLYMENIKRQISIEARENIIKELSIKTRPKWFYRGILSILQSPDNPHTI